MEMRQSSFFAEVLKIAAILILVVVPIRLYIAQPFIVSGASMAPTFATGEYLIVDEISYRFSAPERGDVVVFRFPHDPSKFFIKRIIGLPGETMRLTAGIVSIVNDAHPDGFVLSEPYITDTATDATSLSVTLEPDQYFVLGDNRSASSDSRTWGPLTKDLIVGEAFIRLFPISELDMLPGATNLNTK